MSTTPPDPPGEAADFDLDAVEAPVDLTPFRFTWQGRRFAMAHLQGLDMWELTRAADGGEMRTILATFEAALGEQWAAFRAAKIPQYKVRPLFDAYLAHCSPPEDEDDEETGGPAPDTP